MRNITIFAATLGAILALAAPAQAGLAEMVEVCNQARKPDLKIGGCTVVIRSGEFSGGNLAVAYNNRGNAYVKLGKQRPAIEDYDQALRLNPGYAEAYYNRGQAYTKLGEQRRAIEDYDLALRLNPGYTKAYNNRGYAYEKLGEYAKAIEDYDQALRLNPDYANAYQNRGVSYEFLGQYERAAGDWEQAIRIDGAPRAKWWQKYLKGKGHYAGAIDGTSGPGMRSGLLACAVDPAC